MSNYIRVARLRLAAGLWAVAAVPVGLAAPAIMPVPLAAAALNLLASFSGRPATEVLLEPQRRLGRLLLAAAFPLAITPIAAALRRLGVDPLARVAPARSSYWRRS